jgi:YebC/PmpR family DNA-binding regulatory protein
VKNLFFHLETEAKYVKLYALLSVIFEGRMSGHSKWSTIKRKKGKADLERGKAFSKVTKEITVAARTGGGDENSNLNLRQAIEKAKSINMPSANIDKAVKKGTGELPGTVYEETVYEGYGPGGAAVLIEGYTDNKNRTVAEIRHLFSKFGGNLGENGCVAWMFEKKGVIIVENWEKSEEELLDMVLESGGQDLNLDERTYEIITKAEDLEHVRSYFNENGVKHESAEVTMIPKNLTKVEGKYSDSVIKLMEALEDHDDVQNVYSNFDIET